jgi:hypothetical protein
MWKSWESRRYSAARNGNPEIVHHTDEYDMLNTFQLFKFSSSAPWCCHPVFHVTRPTIWYQNQPMLLFKYFDKLLVERPSKFSDTWFTRKKRSLCSLKIDLWSFLIVSEGQLRPRSVSWVNTRLDLIRMLVILYRVYINSWNTPKITVILAYIYSSKTSDVNLLPSKLHFT